MVPAWSSRHAISCFRHLSQIQAEIPLIPAVQISRASSVAAIVGAGQTREIVIGVGPVVVGRQTGDGLDPAEQVAAVLIVHQHCRALRRRHPVQPTSGRRIATAGRQTGYE